jgi:Tfp pilus assembly PilM family ATPase
MMGRPTPTLIGLDVCSRSIHAIQMIRENSAWHISGYARLDRPTEAEATTAAEVALLAERASEQGLSGSGVSMCLATTKHLSTLMDIPPISSGAPIGEITRVELCRETSKNPEHCETAWWPLPSSGRMNESDRAMVVGCQISDADEAIEPVERAGFVVQVLDLRAAALLRACRGVLGQSDCITPLLEIGHHSGLIALAVGQTLVYQRRVDFAGVHSIHRLLMTQLGVDAAIADHLLFEVGIAGADPIPPIARLPEVRDLLQSVVDRIAEEVRSSIGFTTHKYNKLEVMPLLICGEGGAIPGMTTTLARLLACECRVVTPQLLLGGDCNVTDPSLIAAIGLAMHGAAA